MTQRINRDGWHFRPGPRTVSKKTSNGRVIADLTQTNLPNDRYRYYHATKGWRSRRAWSVTDHGLNAYRQWAGLT